MSQRTLSENTCDPMFSHSGEQWRKEEIEMLNARNALIGIDQATR
jgi:hypothetical protein